MDKSKFEETLFHVLSGETCTRLRQILEDDLDQINRYISQESLYEQPNWALIQAHHIGRKKQIELILSLIKIGDDDK